MDFLQGFENYLWLIALASIAIVVLALWYARSRGFFSGTSRQRSDGFFTSSSLSSLTNLRTHYSGEATLKDLIQNSKTSEATADGWLLPEVKVCQDFEVFYRNYTDDDWIKSRSPKLAEEYLSAAHEGSRHPKPFWVYFLFIVMVIAESYAFNLLLADYIAVGSTPSQQFYAAWGLCILFSIVFIGFAEWAGRHQYAQSLAYYAFKNCPTNKDLIRGQAVAVTIGNNDDDKTEPESKRIVNRSDKVSDLLPQGGQVRAVSRVLICVVALVVSTMAGIYAFRVYDLNMKENQENTIKSELTRERSDIGSGKGATKAPSDLRTTQENADRSAQEAQQSDKRAAFYWAFAIFSVLFLGVQAIGILLAYTFGFASNQGEDAYKRRKMSGFISDAEHKAQCSQYARETVSFANQTLLSLQQLMNVLSKQTLLPATWNTALKTSGDRTFEEYLDRQTRSGEQRTARRRPAAPEPDVQKTDGMLEFVVMDSNLTRVAEGQATEADLYRKMARNELPKGALHVRASASANYIPWSEFIGSTTDKTV